MKARTAKKILSHPNTATRPPWEGTPFTREQWLRASRAWQRAIRRGWTCRRPRCWRNHWRPGLSGEHVYA